MVYGIEVDKIWRRIGISNVWTRQELFLNGRASVSLECTNSPDGECRSISYGIVEIRKLVGEFSDCMDWQ